MEEECAMRTVSETISDTSPTVQTYDLDRVGR